MVFAVVGGTQDTGYDIDNSLRFNYPDNPQLSFTPSSDGNKRVATASFWLKRGVSRASNDLHIMGSQEDGSNLYSIRIRSSGNADVFQFLNAVSGSTSNGFTYKTNASFRDHSAWYHFVVAMDVTQSDGNNGLKLYVNGVLQTAYSISNYNQNVDVSFNTSGEAMKIGIKSDDTDPFDGYLAEFHWIDGTQKQASDFGEYNDNGVWIPKRFSGSYGTNGFKLEFQDSGNLGDDTSGNTNDFTATNLTATDQTTDTPTNNFCTFNPIFTGQRGTFSEGNTKLVTSVQGSVNYGQSVIGTFLLTSGKWYWEIEVDAVGSGGNVGIGVNERIDAGIYNNGHNNLGSTGTAFYKSDGNIQIGGGSNISNTSYTSGDIISVALDLDNSRIYWAKNGVYQSNGSGTGNPSTGANPVTLTSSYDDGWVVFCSKDDTNNNATFIANFGNYPVAVSSGNADANGYGNFEYAVPSGFYSLCTKNLAEFG